MVAWEKQIEERSVPEWRDKYVAYARLKRKLEQIKQPEATGSNNNDDAFTRAAMNDCEWARRISWTVDNSSAGNPFLEEEQTQQKQEEFMEAVEQELVRVGEWYKDKVTALEARVRQLDDEEGLEGEAALSGSAGAEVVSALHLEAVRLTEFVILNVEALRKIVKKMDKQCGTSYQKVFVEKSLKQSPLATKASDQPFNGERARACRRALEELVSPERIQELRSQAMESGGVGLSTKHWSLTRTLVSICCALMAFAMSQNSVPLAKAQRCLGLMIFTVVMWVSEAAPFEATAMLVAPLAAALDVMDGSKEDQAKKLLASVFNIRRLKIDSKKTYCEAISSSGSQGISISGAQWLHHELHLFQVSVGLPRSCLATTILGSQALPLHAGHHVARCWTISTAVKRHSTPAVGGSP